MKYYSIYIDHSLHGKLDLNIFECNCIFFARLTQVFIWIDAQIAAYRLPAHQNSAATAQACRLAIIPISLFDNVCMNCNLYILWLCARRIVCSIDQFTTSCIQYLCLYLSVNFSQIVYSVTLGRFAYCYHWQNYCDALKRLLEIILYAAVCR